MLIFTACWQRPHIFEVFLTKLPKKYPLCVVGEKTDQCYEVLQKERPDAIWVESENRPLGRKFNNGLKAISGYEFDYIFITGSDDMFTPGLFEHYESLKGKYHYCGLLDFYFTDLERVRYFSGHAANRKGEPIGSGRMIQRQVLEKLDWQLWDDGINHAMDLSATRRMSILEGMQNHFFRCKDLGEYALGFNGVAGGNNIQSMDQYPGEWVDREALKKFGLS